MQIPASQSPESPESPAPVTAPPPPSTLSQRLDSLEGCFWGMEERGAGNMFNIPLPPDCGDSEYARVYDEIAVPVARRFKPQLILVSAGFDAHWSESLASMCLSINSYAQITLRIKALADEFCAGQVVFSLEGGYELAALAGNVKAIFEVLLGKPDIEDRLGSCPSMEKPPDIAPFLARLKKSFGLS